MPDESTPRERSTRRVMLTLDQSKGANQADAKGADINRIVAQHKKSGTLPNVQLKNPLYGDFTFGDDLQEQRNAIYEAEDRFQQLPADVRAAADNDMVRFMQMFNDPAERASLEAAGLTITPTTPPNNSPPPLSEETTGTTTTDSPETPTTPPTDAPASE